MERRSVNTMTTLAIFFVAAAVVLIGGLAMVPTTSPIQEAYADATTCRHLGSSFSECASVGKEPSSCTTFLGFTSCDQSPTNKESGQFTGAIHRECSGGNNENCTVEGGKP